MNVGIFSEGEKSLGAQMMVQNDGADKRLFNDVLRFPS